MTCNQLYFKKQPEGNPMNEMRSLKKDYICLQFLDRPQVRS